MVLSLWLSILQCDTEAYMCITITKNTGNLGNFIRNYASHKALLLILTDCLFLFSILLARAPDAGMKLRTRWDENSWLLLTTSHPKCSTKAVPHRRCCIEFARNASLHSRPEEGCFFTGLYTLSPSDGAPWYARGQIHLGSVLAALSHGRKVGKAGCETSLKPRCPGCPSPPRHCMTLPTWTLARQWLIWI